jgi:hypothetical protein
MHSATLSFICTVGNHMTIHFPRKRCISVSITHTIRTRDRGAKKFGSLKDFEVRGVHKNEPWAQWIRFINLIGTVIYPKHEKDGQYDCPITLSIAVPDRPQPKLSARSAVHEKYASYVLLYIVIN